MATINKLKIRSGTNLSNAGTPDLGELIFKSNSNELYIGDGSTAASSLTAIGGSATSVTLGGHTMNDVDIGSEFNDVDDHLMTSGAIKEKIESYSYLTSVPNHSAALLTSGTVPLARISNISDSQIASDALISASKLNELPASKITSGTFADARIPNLAASKITSGTIPSARLDADTAHLSGTQTFSGAKTFTGRLTISDAGADGLHLNQDTGATSNSNRLFFTGSATSAIMQSGSALSFRSGATAGSSSGTQQMYINSSGMTMFNNINMNANAISGVSGIYGNGGTFIGYNTLYQFKNTTGGILATISGSTLDIPNSGDWSFIKNNTNSGGLRFGTKNSGGTYANQIEISNTGNYVKLNENTSVTGYSSATEHFQLNFSGSTNSLLKIVNSGWTNETTHDILFNYWQSNLGDYTYLKSAGNSTSGHGIALVGDSVFAVGDTTVATGAVTNSATAPFTDTWFTVNGSGNAVLKGSLTLGSALAISQGGTGATSAHNARIGLGLGNLAELSSVDAATITDNSVGAAELNVSGNGTNGQVLKSDGDGTFSWFSLVSSSNASTLDNLDSTQFLRSDTADTMSAALTLGNMLYINGNGDQMIRFQRSGADVVSIEQDSSQLYFYNRTTSKVMFLMSETGSATLGYNSNPTLELRNTATGTGSGPSLVFGHSQSGTNSTGRISTYLTDGSQANRTGLMRFWHRQAGTEYLKLQLGDNYVRQYQKGDVGDYLETIVNDDHVDFHVASGNYVQISTDSGYCQIGPMNTSHNHIYTDRSSHYMNKALYVLSNTLLNTSGNSYINNVNLGIGTTSPSAKLDVKSQINVTNSGNATMVGLKGTNWGYSSSYKALQIGNTSGTYSIAFGYDPSTNSSSSFTGDGREVIFRNGVEFTTPNAANNGFHNDVVVLKDGKVGLSTAAPSYKLDVDGDIRAQNGHVFYGDSTSGVLSTGSWAGDLTSNGWERVCGVNHDGGEFVLLEKNGQVSTLIDGSYFAYEAGSNTGGGFWSSSNSSYAAATGIIASGGTLYVKQADGTNASFYVTGDTTVGSGYISSKDASTNLSLRRGTNDDDRIVIEASETKIYGDAVERVRFGSYGIRNGYDGTNSAPAYSFKDDTDTGMRRNGSGVIDFINDGIRRLRIEADGDLVLSSDGSVQGASIHRIGGLYFTWDRDSYGTNQQHAILCSSDDLIINSFDNVTINLDSNNNDTAEAFAVRRHGIDLTSGELLYQIDQDGNSYTMASSQVGNGSAASPSLSFFNDTDTGFYRKAANHIGFSTAGEEQMYLADGTLHITQPVKIQFANDQRIFDNGSGGLKLGAASHELQMYAGGSDPIQLYTGGISGSERLRIVSGGNAHFDQDVIAFSSTPSDIRLKENFTKIDNGLDVISKLDGQTFNWKKSGDRLSAGFKAQEVEKVLPHLVDETKLPLQADDDKDYKVLRYEELIPYLVEAIKEQQVQIDELKTKLGE